MKSPPKVVATLFATTLTTGASAVTTASAATEESERTRSMAIDWPRLTRIPSRRTFLKPWSSASRT